MVFTGSAPKGYALESFKFAPAGPAHLTYGRYLLSAATMLRELARMLGPLETHKAKNGALEAIVRNRGATAMFTFKASRLAEYTYEGAGC